MVKILALLTSLLILPVSVYADGPGLPPLTVQEEDSSPSIIPVFRLKFSNGTVTDNADGSASISISGLNGFSLTGDGDGAITFLGAGDGFDEDLTLNFDDTENTIVGTSSTGATLLSLPVFDIAVEDEAYEATNWNGSLQVPTKNSVRDKIESLTASDTFQLTSTVLNAITSTSSLTLGSASREAKLFIDGDTNEIQLKVQGNATQTNDVVLIEQSGGTDLFRISNDGTIAAGGTGTEAMTFGGGTQATHVTTYDLSGTDWTMTAGSGLATYSGGVTVTGTTTTPTLTLSGTGTINGLDSIDSTGEDTIEALIFDADAESISGVWEVQDDVNFVFGTDADWLAQYDEGVDNQLLFITANTSAVNIFDPMVEFLVGTTPTADQQLFGIGKGTQDTNVSVFYVDEDGDTGITGALTISGDGTQSVITEGLVINNGAGTDADDAFTVKGSATNLLQVAPARSAVNMAPLASPPSSATSGDLYVDSTASPDELCFYDGAGWQGISSGTDANCA